MTATAGRARELLLNACLATTTAAAHLGEDPLLFLIQLSRRLPPPLVRALAAALGASSRRRGGGERRRTVRAAPDVRGAYAAWMSGDVATARRVVDEASSTGARRLGRTGRRLLAELAVQVGSGDVVAAVCPDPPRALTARAAWLRGDLSGAVALLDGTPSALAARYRSELALLRGSATLRAPSSGRAVTGSRVAVSGMGDRAPHGPEHGVPAAFHVLTNSVPHTRSGYTMRSHAVLRGQRAAGVRVAAATRLGYPVSVGVLSARHADVVDGIPYGRLLRPVLPRTVVGRLQRQVDTLAPVLDRFRPTVLHTTTDHTNAAVTRTLAEHLGVPWVYEVRGLLEETWVAGRPSPTEQARAARSERYRLLRERETAMAAAADHVVTLSRTLADELSGRGVSSDRVTVIPNGVDPSLLTTDLSPADARAGVGLPREGLWVGTVSSLVAYEGLETLLRAVAELRARGFDVRACIVGDGVARASLEQEARRLAITPHTVFTGRVPPSRAVLYHQALDVFAVPRRDVRVCRLVTPLKPIEAMACRRPVVASALPALQEIVGDPASGVLVPAADVAGWADALAALAEDPAERDRLGRRGRAFAGGRTWEAAGRAYRALYEQLATAA